MFVATNKFTLDRFESYSSDLTTTHRRQIDAITTSIENSFNGSGSPRFSMIKIKGHAAYFAQNPNPRVPYVTQGQNRADKVLGALDEKLRSRRLQQLVEFWSVSSAGADDPVTHNRTQSARAKNRRVEVEISQIDTRLAPWRWICRVEVDFGQDVHSPYQPYGQSMRKGVGTGVLISDRHVLTNAHNVCAFRQSKSGQGYLGFKYAWVGAKKIKVSPGWIGNGTLNRKPFGTRQVVPEKTRIFPGFQKPFDQGDYNWDGTMDHQANFSKSGRDLAIVEIKRDFPRRPLWWGQAREFPIGMGSYSLLDEIGRRRDFYIRTAGFGDLHECHDRYMVTDCNLQLMFSKGLYRRYRQTDLIIDDDISTEKGHSGGAVWAKDNSNRARLIAIHMGRNQHMNGDVAVALSPSKMKWINKIIH